MAIYDEQEGEVEVGPCMLGATTLMAQAHRPFACLPCGYRTLNSCSLWEVPLQELMPVRCLPLICLCPSCPLTQPRPDTVLDTKTWRAALPSVRSCVPRLQHAQNRAHRL